MQKACVVVFAVPHLIIRARTSQVEWNVGDVQEFLGRCSNKLGYKTSEYQRIVGENDIDGEVLKDLDDDDLQRLGIKSFGHRYVADLARTAAKCSRSFAV